MSPDTTEHGLTAELLCLSVLLVSFALVQVLVMHLWTRSGHTAVTCCWLYKNRAWHTMPLLCRSGIDDQNSLTQLLWVPLSHV